MGRGYTDSRGMWYCHLQGQAVQDKWLCWKLWVYNIGEYSWGNVPLVEVVQ